MHVSKFFSYINPFSNQSTKPIITQAYNKTYMHKHQIHFFKELETSVLPLLEDHIMLVHAGIINHIPLF